MATLFSSIGIGDTTNAVTPWRCDQPMYVGDGSPKCDLPYLHILDGKSYGDDHGLTIETTRVGWSYTYCWQFHDDAQREAGWNCTEPVGHDVTES